MKDVESVTTNLSSSRFFKKQLQIKNKKNTLSFNLILCSISETLLLFFWFVYAAGEQIPASPDNIPTGSRACNLAT